MSLKTKLKIVFAASLMLLTLSGCMTSLSPDTYGNSNAGQASRAVKGVVYNARVVKVAGTSAVGTLAGGAVGAIAGSAIGGGRGSILTAIGGGLLGAGVGNAVENRLTTQYGMEYVVKTNRGNFLSVVQGTSPAFQKGQHVLVIFGEKSRVIADPEF